jgi:hypothetical protein
MLDARKGANSCIKAVLLFYTIAFCQHPASSALGEEDTVTHVLIIISWLGGAVQGAAISTQEFTSAERCDAARLALIDYAKARGAEETLRGFCKEK